jgi:hypothetical protein
MIDSTLFLIADAKSDDDVDEEDNELLPVSV